MYIVYNEGYKLIERITTKSGRTYTFRKGYVTEVLEDDAEFFLNLTSRDIQWCPKKSRTTPPFLTLLEYTAKENISEEDMLNNYLVKKQAQ